MNDGRQAFGLTLRTHREQLGITLSHIAESTKISVALLSALERGDVSRWPKGIFRRSFFREYVVAIGLPPEPYLADFGRLFPDEPALALIAEKPAEFRLTLAAGNTSASSVLKRAAIVLTELAAIALVGAAMTWVVAVDALPAIGFTALAYYPVTSLCVERKLAIRTLRSLVKSPLAVAAPESRRLEGIDGHEELQVSF